MYLATATFAREIVALAIFSVKQFLRIVRPFVAIANATLACTMTAADLGGLIIGFAVGHRDRFVSTVASLALALLPIKAGIAGTHATHGRTFTLASYCVRLISLCREI